jgi:hypothetical protein
VEYRRTPTYVAPTYVDPDLRKKLIVPLPPPHPPLPLPQFNTTMTPVSIINYYCFFIVIKIIINYYYINYCIRYIIKHGSELRKNRLTHRVAKRSTYVSRGLSVIINDTSRWIPRIESLYKGCKDDVSNSNAHLHITKV